MPDWRDAQTGASATGTDTLVIKSNGGSGTYSFEVKADNVDNVSVSGPASKTQDTEDYKRFDSTLSSGGRDSHTIQGADTINVGTLPPQSEALLNGSTIQKNTQKGGDASITVETPAIGPGSKVTVSATNNRNTARGEVDFSVLWVDYSPGGSEKLATVPNGTSKTVTHTFPTDSSIEAAYYRLSPRVGSTVGPREFVRVQENTGIPGGGGRSKGTNWSRLYDVLVKASRDGRRLQKVVRDNFPLPALDVLVKEGRLDRGTARLIKQNRVNRKRAQEVLEAVGDILEQQRSGDEPAETPTRKDPERPSPDIQVKSVDIATKSPSPGSTINALVRYRNNGGRGKQKFPVSLNGETVDTVSLSAPANATRNTTVSVEAPQSGTATVAVGGKSDSVGVADREVEAPEDNPPSITITEVNARNNTVTVGKANTIEVSATNTGGRGSTTFSVQVNGKKATSVKFELDNGQGETKMVEVEAASAGDYTVTVADKSTSFTAKRKQSDDSQDTPEDSPADTPQDSPQEPPQEPREPIKLPGPEPAPPDNPQQQPDTPGDVPRQDSGGIVKTIKENKGLAIVLGGAAGAGLLELRNRLK